MEAFAADSNGTITVIPVCTLHSAWRISTRLKGLNKGCCCVEIVARSSCVLSQKGDIVPLSLKEGDKVLLPEFGGTKVEIEDKEYYLFKDSDILGKWSDNSSH
ncbi:HSPE1 [Cordylochernes scorpioides]|uniref:HSPE1 n=1 Tax=Cordylochernes scorpioides TaxID=51811 RepID=A0ABY6K1U8_9ARAC|nr:HSPE1 [Cordylochernes scorpioides]